MKAAIASPFSPTSSRTRRAKPLRPAAGISADAGVKPRPVTPPGVVPALFSTISTGSSIAWYAVVLADLDWTRDPSGG